MPGLLNLIVSSPGAALVFWIALRSEPGPPFLAFLTVKVVSARAGPEQRASSSPASTSADNTLRVRIIGTRTILITLLSREQVPIHHTVRYRDTPSRACKQASYPKTGLSASWCFHSPGQADMLKC